MINIRVERKRQSYNFKADPSKPGSFENNWKNNSLDSIIIRDDHVVLALYRCQTVANYCFGAMASAATVEFGDTIAPGNFTIKTFVEPRNFHGEIHGITRTRDIDGEWIDCNSMQTTKGGFQNGRFLVHDRYSFKTNSDTNHAWSAGCFILSSIDLASFNQVLKTYNVKPGDLISGTLIEE
ncbi:MAG: hypothetical protein FWC19_06480 [Treponema sp.]|nr:hypothetical protein [Treponema sp.]MCL2272430.1 hypothetical protein [Treponema sp.]